MKYKHYSFDLWQTLIRSNPTFKIERTKYFQKHFNKENKSYEEVHEIIREVDLSCNYANEIVGNSISAAEMYVMILSKLEYPMDKLTYLDLDSINNIVTELFFKYIPFFYDSNTKDVLRKLKASGCTMSILSNTGFMCGNTMRAVLSKLDLANIFSFQLYSDELDCSKPNLAIFLTMLDQVNHARRTSPLRHFDIVHVGGNKKVDGGAKEAGIDCIIINSTELTIKDIE